VVPYGKGSFYFHTNPIIFTNYYLKTDDGYAYAQKSFSHLNKGKIYWDEFHKVFTTENSGGGSGFSKSPIKLVLANRSLKWAWYLTLSLIGFYIIFFAKRKQRPVPVLEKNVNTSLEFVKTVGTLYFRKNQHRRLIKLKLRYFFSFVRQKYFISTGKINEDLLRKISLKSGIDYELIKKIFAEYNLANRYDRQIDADDLIRLHALLEHFYKNCK
jgi:hypothetical protein